MSRPLPRPASLKVVLVQHVLLHHHGVREEDPYPCLLAEGEAEEAAAAAVEVVAVAVAIAGRQLYWEGPRQSSVVSTLERVWEGYMRTGPRASS